MRKNLLMYCLAVSLLQLGFYSCKDDAVDEQNGEQTEEQKGEETEKEEDSQIDLNAPWAPTKTAEEQQKLLETVGAEVVQKVDLKRFDDVAALVSDVISIYVNGNDFDPDPIVEMVSKGIEGCLASVKPYEDENSKGNVYNYLYVASNITGHFTADDKSKQWKYEKADDLQFKLKDGKGKDCVLTLTTKGAVTPVLVSDYTKSNTLAATTELIPEEKKQIDRIKESFGIPEELEIVVTQEQKKVLELTLKTDLKLAGERIDIATDKLNIGLTLKSNGYVINVKQVAMEHELMKAEWSLSDGDTPLLSVKAGASGTFTNSGDLMEEIGDLELMVDILGKVQVAGTVKQAVNVMNKFMESMNTDDAEKLKAIREEINQKVNLGIYYDNKGAKQALINFDLLNDEETNSLYMAPVVTFSEKGGKYVITDYFSEENFKEMIQAIETLLMDFDNFMDKIFNPSALN